MKPFFEIVAGDAKGPRIGRLHTAHGTIETPAFMPVGTRGAVKGLTPFQLRDVGATIMLANAYHLADRPGEDVVEKLGGLHEFTGWDGPILTDSGGFQVYSLAELRSIDDDGVVFQSPVDGRALKLTPEGILDVQRRLGCDIAMVLDHCPGADAGRDGAAVALERTLSWARRSVRHREALVEQDPTLGDRMAVFGILQGGAFEDLRRQGAEELRDLPFDGYAIGGVSVGEDRDALFKQIRWGTSHLPLDKPRYLMGVGGLEEFATSIACGIDLWDCVIPTRNARNGHLFRRRKPTIRIKNARYADDARPIDEDCDCATCATYSRGFLRHLILRKEILGATLTSIHNLRVFLGFLEHARAAIGAGNWNQFLELEGLGEGVPGAS